MAAIGCVIGVFLILSSVYANERMLATVVSMGNTETSGFDPTLAGIVGDGDIIPDGVPTSIVGPGGNGFNTGLGVPPGIGGNDVSFGLGGLPNMGGNGVSFGFGGLTNMGGNDVGLGLGGLPNMGGNGVSLGFGGLPSMGGNDVGLGLGGLSSSAGIGNLPGGSPNIVLSDLDFNGMAGGALPGAGIIPMDADLSMMIGGDTVDVDAFIPAMGPAAGNSLSGPADMGIGGVTGVNGVPIGTGGGLINFGDNIGDFGLGGNGDIVNGDLMTIPGPTGINGGGISLGSPVNIDGSVGGMTGVSGFTDFGQLPGLGSINPFSGQFGTQPGPWNTNAWPFGSGGQTTGLLIGPDVGGGTAGFPSTMEQPPNIAIPINILPSGIQSAAQFPAQGMETINNIQAHASMGNSFPGGFGGQNLGPLNNGLLGTTVIRDSDTAFINTRIPAVTGSLSMPISIPPHTAVRPASLPMPRWPIISGQMQRRLPFRPLPPRFILRGGQAGSPLFGRSRMPFSRPGLQSLIPRRPLLGSVTTTTRQARPFPNVWPRMGLSTSSRGTPLRSNFGIRGVSGGLRFRVLPRIARISTVSSFERSGLVPGNKGYSQYYRNKYTPRTPVMRRRLAFPRRRIYRRNGPFRRRITTARRMY